MATYIQGVTDYIPQIQPFQPDYNFLGNIMQTRQSRYDSAHKQISSIYGTLLNAPLSRDENINARDQFFKTVDTDIQKISGLDLSLKQNQDQAEQVFKPFWENKDMVRDMVWTKNKDTEMMKGENLRYCVDSEKCGGEYWDGGMDYLKLKTEEYRKASKEDARNFENVRFTPLINVTDKAIKAAKDAGFKVSYDELHGGYMVTTKNGSRMVRPLTDFFMNKFGSDPQVTAYYKTQAYLNRKQFVMQHAAEFGGEDKAEIEYVNKLYTVADKTVKDDKVKAEKNVDLTKTIKDAAEQHVKEKGVMKNDRDFIDDLLNIDQEHKDAVGVHELATKNEDLLKSANKNQGNIKYSRDSIDQLVAHAMLKNELGTAAQAYSDLTSEVDYKADAFALQANASRLAFNNQVAIKKGDHEYDAYKREQDYKYFQKREQFKHDLKDQEDKGTLAPPTFNKNVVGTSTTMKENQAINANKEYINNIENSSDAQGGSRAFLGKLTEALKANYEETGKSGDATKQKLISATAKLIFSSTGIDGTRLVNGDVAELDKLNKLDPKMLNAVYAKAVQTVDPNKSTLGKINGFWSKDLWNQTTTDRSNADLHDQIQKEAIAFSEKQSTNVTSSLMAKYMVEDKDNKKANIAKALADEDKTGFVNDLPTDYEKQQFAARYAKQYAKDFNGDATKAYDYALDNVEDVVKDWTGHYQDKAVAFNHLDFFGKHSNGVVSGAYDYQFDAALKKNNNTRVVYEVMQNALNAPGAIFKFGDGTSIPANSEEAKKIVQAISDDMYKSTSKDKVRPIGTASISRVGGYNDNYMMMTIPVPEEWANKAAYKGSAKNQGITFDKAYQGGITMFIPKNEATNSFYKDTEMSPRQWLLDQGKPIKIKGGDGNSYVEIVKSGDTYNIVSNLPQGWDPKTQKIIYQKVSTPHYSDGYSADLLVSNYSNILEGVTQAVQTIKDDETAKLGMTQLNEVYKYAAQLE